MLEQLAGFVGVCVLVTLVPGLDTALVTRNVLLKGRRAGFLAALGIATGLYTHALAVALGVATLLEHFAVALTALRLCGAVYLGALGMAAIWSSFHSGGRRGRAYDTPGAQARIHIPTWLRPLHPHSAYAQGLLSDLTNPKAFLFFLTFLPQFLTPGQHALPFALVLASIAAAITLAWLCVYSLAVGQLTPLLHRPSVRRWIDRVIGVIFVAFGIHLAVERGT